MNEEQKHIESCRSEDVLSQSLEACGNENDLQAALQPLLAETMPGYVPVETTAPTSPIAELPNVLVSIIRRVATKPLTMFGDRPAKQSLLGSLVTTWNAIRQRLSGNPSAGIPDRRAEMTAHSLPTALALLNDRKIANSGDGIGDGAPFAKLMFNSSYRNLIAGLGDTSDEPWVFNVDYINLTNIVYARLNIGSISLPSRDGAKGFLYNCTDLNEVSIPNLETISFGNSRNGSANFISSCPALTELSLPSLKSIKVGSTEDGTNNFLSTLANLESVELPELEEVSSTVGSYTSWLNFLSGCSKLRSVSLPKLKKYGFGSAYTNRCHSSLLRNCPLLDEVEIGTEVGDITSPLGISGEVADSFSDCPNLIKIVLGGSEGCVKADVYILAGWNPTNVLADQDNLQQFLSNFLKHIAKKLANRTGLSKLTLTLSANVFSAVFTNESGSTEEIVARNAIRDEIRGEITDRNWKVTDSTNNFNN